MMENQDIWDELRGINRELRCKASLALILLLAAFSFLFSWRQLEAMKELERRLEPYGIQYQC